jgi:hypothetical protein
VDGGTIRHGWVESACRDRLRRVQIPPKALLPLIESCFYIVALTLLALFAKDYAVVRTIVKHSNRFKFRNGSCLMVPEAGFEPATFRL